MHGAVFGGAKIWNSEILQPRLSVLFTVHTNAIVVTIRISIIEYLIAGVGRQQRRLSRGANTLAPPMDKSQWRKQVSLALSFDPDWVQSVESSPI